MKWFDPSNSTVQPWLEFNGTLPTLGPCQLASQLATAQNSTRESDWTKTREFDWTNANCSQVCNDTRSLLAVQHSHPRNQNLATCGIWLALFANNTSIDGSNRLRIGDGAKVHWDDFGGLSLDLGALQLAQSSAYAIGTIFEGVYDLFMLSSSSLDENVPTACVADAFFSYRKPPDYLDLSARIQLLHDCLNTICSPVTLNPDLAGIGVFLSFLIQSSIAVVSFAALLGLRWYSSSHRGKLHTDALVTALVDFHKSQCYFSSTIQTTALILSYQRYMTFKELTAGEHVATLGDIFDTSVLVALATTGFLPITLTLTCIVRYGRLSWYLLILSLITTILATATLTFSSIRKYVQDGIFYKPFSGGLINPEPVLALCGSSNLKINSIAIAANASSWVWVIWAICITWLLFCLSKKLRDDKWCERWLKEVQPILNRYAWMGPLERVRAYRFWGMASVAIWALCFGAQFYLFSLYFRHFVINPKWTFGQIIAITVWVPSLFEYVYIKYIGIEEASKYKYPSPFKVMKLIVQQSVSMAVIDPYDPSLDEESVPATEADDSRLL